MQETNILLVEDDRMIIENLTEFLKTEGFQVWSADGQEKAMKILRNQHFDLILSGLSHWHKVMATAHVPRSSHTMRFPLYF